MLTGLLVLVVAGMLQGLFVLPLTFTRNWEWEHHWLAFSFMGMIALNWLSGFLLFPQVIVIYQKVPLPELLLIFSFGLSWGLGAILFGLGMQKLGMSVGYPVIMGLIAGVGTLLPLIVIRPQAVFTASGMGVIAGCLVVIAGIVVCSRAVHLRDKQASSFKIKRGVRVGMIIAVFAGILSALPNIGMTFANRTIAEAMLAGIPKNMAGNCVWLLFFSVGFVANGAYTIYLIIKHHSFQGFVKSMTARNLFFTFLAALFWLGSFYLYGFSASMLGSFGSIAGWPLFISISIVTGNLAGIWRGEWQHAKPGAVLLLRYGMAVFLVAVLIIGLSNFL